MSDNRFLLEELRRTPLERQRIELVERKGKGHPDSICDALAEAVSLALCREFQAAFGRILHHNTDKALLVAGRTQPRLGGGEVVEPMRLVLGDRAASEYHGRRIEVGAIAEASAKGWLRENLRFVDPERHLVFQNELKEGSPELTDLFEREVVGANDTSAAVGYAPLTETERLVLAAEQWLNSPDFHNICQTCRKSLWFRMRAALIRSFAHTHVRTRARPRTQAGNGAKPPPNDVALPYSRSMSERVAYNCGPYAACINAMLRKR
jgi:S-adenosylmethionine synthetase